MNMRATAREGMRLSGQEMEEWRSITCPSSLLGFAIRFYHELHCWIIQISRFEHCHGFVLFLLISLESQEMQPSIISTV